MLDTAKHQLRVRSEFYGILPLKNSSSEAIDMELKKKKKAYFHGTPEGPKVRRLVVSRTSSKPGDFHGKICGEHAGFWIHISISLLWLHFFYSQ